MGQVFYTVSTVATTAAAATRSTPISGPYANNAVEARVQMTLRTAGEFSNLAVIVASNANTGTSTVFLRKNTANGNLNVSIPTVTTGTFEDTTNTDSIASGDLVCLQVITGATGTLGITNFSTQFSASSNTSQKLISTNDANFSTDSVTNFAPLSGSLAWGATEANCQTKFRTAGTIKNAALFVRVNSRTTTSTIGTRKNGAAGALSISIGAAVTGILEDTTNSDTIVSTDLACYFITTGTGGGNLNVTTLGVDFETTDNKFQTSGGLAAGTSLTNLTRFFALHNGTAFTSEATAASECNLAFTASRVGAYCSANAATGASTIDFRINSASSAVTCSAGAGLTGWFEDTTNSANVVADDNINIRIVSGTGGAITWHTVTLVGETSAPPPPTGGARSFGFIF